MNLSNYLGRCRSIRHRINRPDGTYSTWRAILSNDKIVYKNPIFDSDDNLVYDEHVFASIDAFASAHAISEGLTLCDSWEECETFVHGDWTKLSVMRDSYNWMRNLNKKNN